MDDLFFVEESLSPKEAWKKQHDIVCLQPEQAETGDGPDGDVEHSDKWIAWSTSLPEERREGDTEEQALFRLATANKINFYKPLPKST